jgi:DNA modification methylase
MLTSYPHSGVGGSQREPPSTHGNGREYDMGSSPRAVPSRAVPETSTKPPGNLYYGDNLDILRRYVNDESVDLIYLDPPFNSAQDYNILFAEKDGTAAASQIKAFGDTWHWDQASAAEFEEIVEGGGRVAEVMLAFRALFRRPNDMLAYLTMMAPRLIELHRVLQPWGSIYLHCDSTASHYLKLLMDGIFEPQNFRNEVVWRRTGAHNKVRRFGPVHDSILFYTKTDKFKWNYPKRPYMRGHVEENFVQEGDKYKTDYYGNVLTGSGVRGGESGQPWRGFNPTAKKRHWAVPGAVLSDIDDDLSELSQHEKLDRLFDLGFIKIIPGQAWPIYERYLHPNDGQALSDMWAFQPYTENTVFGTEKGIDEDVRWLHPKDQERVGYPTQKPLGLLERIIRASSDQDDVVLDPFCGCGTAVSAAHYLKRKWIGIDITHLAIALIRYRMYDAFGGEVKSQYKVTGEPTSLPDARALAGEDRHQFELWALGLVDARPNEKKKGSDFGIDGNLLFHDEPTGGRSKKIKISVKSGHVSVRDVRDLRGVIERERAQIGVLITLEKPTRDMTTEASTAGFYRSPFTGENHARMQILTIEKLLDGRTIDFPGARIPLRRAPIASRRRASEQIPLPMKTTRGGG